jgi:hypothetical protein
LDGGRDFLLEEVAVSSNFNVCQLLLYLHQTFLNIVMPGHQILTKSVEPTLLCINPLVLVNGGPIFFFLNFLYSLETILRLSVVHTFRDGLFKHLPLSGQTLTNISLGVIERALGVIKLAFSHLEGGFRRCETGRGVF